MESKLTLPTWEQIPDIELYMDQVLVLLNKYTCQNNNEPITASMLNNYVKQKLLDSPNKKKYSRHHVSVFYMICILKRVLTITQIKTLLDGLKEEMSGEEMYVLFYTLIQDPDVGSNDESDFKRALYHAVRSVNSAVCAERYLSAKENRQ